MAAQGLAGGENPRADGALVAGVGVGVGAAAVAVVLEHHHHHHHLAGAAPSSLLLAAAVVLRDGIAALDVLVARPVAAQCLVGGEHLLATGALEPPAGGGAGTGGGGAPVGFGVLRRGVGDGGCGGGGAVGEEEQARRHLVVLLRVGGVCGAAEGGRRVDPAPLALGVAAHVAVEGLVGPEALAALGARVGDFGCGGVGFLDGPRLHRLSGGHSEELGALLPRVLVGGGGESGEIGGGREVVGDVGGVRLHQITNRKKCKRMGEWLLMFGSSAVIYVHTHCTLHIEREKEERESTMQSSYISVTKLYPFPRFSPSSLRGFKLDSVSVFYIYIFLLIKRITPMFVGEVGV